MKRLVIIFQFTGLTSRVMRASAVAMTLYVLAKSVFALFNRFNRHAYAAE